MGHREGRCLKVWQGNTNYSAKVLNRFARCSICGKQGHFKCLEEKTTKEIEIDAEMRNDLVEFIQDEDDDESNEDLDPFLSGFYKNEELRFRSGKDKNDRSRAGKIA